MKLLCYVGPGDRSLLRRLDLDPPKMGQACAQPAGGSALPGVWWWRACALAAILPQFAIGARETSAAAARREFALFPRQIGAVAGRGHADRAVGTGRAQRHRPSQRELRPRATTVVNVWSAYYDSQYSGNAAHSPLVCIPGGGWRVEDGGTVAIPMAGGAKLSTPAD